MELRPEALVSIEQTLHINCLKLLAATLAVQTFPKAKLSNLKINNTTAVTYASTRWRGQHHLHYCV